MTRARSTQTMTVSTSQMTLFLRARDQTLPRRPLQGSEILWRNIMMYPYAEFLIDFARKHTQFVHRNCPENTRAAVIVETRPLFFLPLVIRNVMFFLGERWNLHVFCGELSFDYVNRFLQNWGPRIVKLSGTYRLSASDYNKLIMSPQFWNFFTEEKLVVFQSDALLSGSNVEEFESYDYVGAPCGSFDENYIANGGLSLRSRRIMLQCLASFRPKDAGVAEDVFFTSAARGIGAAMPDLDTATRFAVESIYTTHPFGVHGTDKCYHSPEVAAKIVGGIAY